MSAISLKSITGITSITTPAGLDNQLTLHTNNTTERLRITSSGEVGINTTVVPYGNFAVDHGQYGLTRISEYSHILVQNKNASTTQFWNFAPRDNGSVTIGRGVPGSAGIFTDKKITILSDGDVLIGTQTAASKLTVDTGGNATADYISVTSGGTGRLKLGYVFTGGPSNDDFAEILTDTNGDLDIATRGNNSSQIKLFTSTGSGSEERLRIDSTGRLILGGTNAGPYHQDGDEFNIYSTGNTGMSIFSGTSSLGSLFFADGNNDVHQQRRGAIQYNHNGNYLALWTNAGEKLRITSDGALGIGNLQTAQSSTTHTSKTKFYLDSTKFTKIARLEAGSISSAGWYTVAKIASSNGNYFKCYASIGGDFTQDMCIMELTGAFSASGALSNTYAEPVFKAHRVGAHSTDRITRARFVKDSSNVTYLQIYIAGGVNNNTWGKSVLEYNVGAYSQNNADNHSAAMFEAQASGLTGIRTLEVDDNAICVSAGSHKLYSGGNATERLTIDSSGRVRIANTNFNAAGNADELVIGTTSGNRGLTIVSGNTGIGALFFADDGSTNVGSLVYEHNTNQMRMNVGGQQVMRLDYVINNIPKWIIGNDLDTHISLPSANTFAFTTGGTERLRIGSNGSVGIGTDYLSGNNSVYHKLMVEGDTTSTIAVAKIVRKNSSASNSTYTFEVDSSSHTSNVTSGGAMSVDVNGGRAFTIDGNGSVGIQTNLPSAAFLDIASSHYTDSLRLRRISSDTNVASNWSMKPYGGNLYFREGGSTDKISFASNGNLTVHDGSVIAINTGAGSGTSNLELQPYGTQGYINFTGSSHLYLRMGSSYAQKFIFRNNGDLELTDGNLMVASGHGIDFSATPNGHGSPTELLDDYEAGFYTPTLSGSGWSYTRQVGFYRKIGTLVHVSIWIDASGGPNDSTTLQISLPFTSYSNSSYRGGISGSWDSANFINTYTEGRNRSHINANTIYMQASFPFIDNGGWTSGGLRTDGVEDGFQCQMSGTYMSDA